MTPEKFKQAIERWELTDPGAILIDYGAGKQNRNVYRLGPAALERLDSLGIEPEPTGDAGMTPWERRTGRYLRAVKEVGLDGVREMEQATGVARPNLRVALRRLEEAGLVRRVGDGGKGKGDVSAWLLTDPGHAELDSGGAA
jgi:DNA-binding transcriptional ArsR family regulator